LLNVLSDGGIQIPDSLFADARALDRHHIPPRYADAYPSGSPFESYDEQTAYEALKASERVIEFVRKLKDIVRKRAPEPSCDEACCNDLGKISGNEREYAGCEGRPERELHDYCQLEYAYGIDYYYSADK
jgi:hypothetical protein